MGYYTPNVSAGQEQMRQAMAMRSEGQQNIAQATQALGQNTAQWATHFSNLAEGRRAQRIQLNQEATQRLLDAFAERQRRAEQRRAEAAAKKSNWMGIGGGVGTLVGAGVGALVPGGGVAGAALGASLGGAFGGTVGSVVDSSSSGGGYYSGGSTAPNLSSDLMAYQRYQNEWQTAPPLQLSNTATMTPSQRYNQSYGVMQGYQNDPAMALQQMQPGPVGRM
jgi:hypothetical protein